MKAVRIYAVGIEDDKSKFVLIGQMDENGFLNKEVESFGYMTDVDSETDIWLKSVFQLSERNGDGLIFYGDNTYDPCTTNLYKKTLEPGATFSKRYNYEGDQSDEGIMIIRTITDYVQA
jgi:hypothetical protein